MGVRGDGGSYARWRPASDCLCIRRDDKDSVGACDLGIFLGWSVPILSIFLFLFSFSNMLLLISAVSAFPSLELDSDRAHFVEF